MSSTSAISNSSPLRDRIAALQGKTTVSAPPSRQSSPNQLSASGSLRSKIAQFEEKGGVPVPRGSFGLGAPAAQSVSPQRKGELWGNRVAEYGKLSVASHSRAGSLSPEAAETLAAPSARLRRISASGLDADPRAASLRRSTMHFTSETAPTFPGLRTRASSGNVKMPVQDDPLPPMPLRPSLMLADPPVAEATTAARADDVAAHAADPNLGGSPTTNAATASLLPDDMRVPSPGPHVSHESLKQEVLVPQQHDLEPVSNAVAANDTRHSLGELIESTDQDHPTSIKPKNPDACTSPSVPVPLVQVVEPEEFESDTTKPSAPPSPLLDIGIPEAAPADLATGPADTDEQLSVHDHDMHASAASAPSSDSDSDHTASLGLEPPQTSPESPRTPQQVTREFVDAPVVDVTQTDENVSLQRRSTAGSVSSVADIRPDSASEHSSAPPSTPPPTVAALTPPPNTPSGIKRTVSVRKPLVVPKWYEDDQDEEYEGGWARVVVKQR